MRRIYTRIVAGLAAVAAGGLVAYSLRGNTTPAATLAARNQAVEVRTQVIRRTIHIVRHGTTHGHMPGQGGGPSSPARAGAVGARTRTSPGHHGLTPPGSTASGAPVASTRTSGSHSAAPTSSSAAPAARTRTSGSHKTSGSGSTGSPGTVRTRTSSGSRGSSGSSGSAPRTRTSGSHHGEGGDGSGSDN